MKWIALILCFLIVSASYGDAPIGGLGVPSPEDLADEPLVDAEGIRWRVVWAHYKERGYSPTFALDGIGPNYYTGEYGVYYGGAVFPYPRARNYTVSSREFWLALSGGFSGSEITYQNWSFRWNGDFTRWVVWKNGDTSSVFMSWENGDITVSPADEEGLMWVIFSQDMEPPQAEPKYYLAIKLKRDLLATSRPSAEDPDDDEFDDEPTTKPFEFSLDAWKPDVEIKDAIGMDRIPDGFTAPTLSIPAIDFGGGVVFPGQSIELADYLSRVAPALSFIRQVVQALTVVLCAVWVLEELRRS